MNRHYTKKKRTSGNAQRPIEVLRRIFRIPDGSNIIERQRTFVFLYASLGYLIGIPLNLVTSFGPQGTFFYVANSLHALFILLLAGLFIRRVISAYWAALLLILSIQVEIPVEMIHMAHTEGVIMGIPGIFANTILLGMLLILSITAYIRYLPYVQTLLTIAALSVCWYITRDAHIGQSIPVLMMAFLVLSFMGERLIHGVSKLQSSKDDLAREQARVFEFLNIDREDLLRLIKLSRREKLSDKQKNRLLSLLDEQTKASVIEIATDVVEKKRQNLAALEAHELGLTPYEQEICQMILQGNTVGEIARKLRKSTSAITSARALIRSKLGLKKADNLQAALLRLVEEGG